MDQLTPDQARKRFGEILHGVTGTYREFEDPGKGIWRPVYVDGELSGYRLFQLQKAPKRLSWRNKR